FHRTNTPQNASILPVMQSEATRLWVPRIRLPRNSPGLATPACAVLRCHSLIFSANCRISAKRFCRVLGILVYGMRLIPLSELRLDLLTASSVRLAKKIRAVRGKPTARVLDPEIADLLPRAGAAHSKNFSHERSVTLRLMFGNEHKFLKCLEI